MFLAAMLIASCNLLPTKQSAGERLLASADAQLKLAGASESALFNCVSAYVNDHYRSRRTVAELSSMATSSCDQHRENYEKHMGGYRSDMAAYAKTSAHNPAAAQQEAKRRADGDVDSLLRRANAAAINEVIHLRHARR